MATYHQEGQMQLPRADAIRSRLIDTFSLIEHLQGLSQAVPRHTVRELLDPSRQKKLMWEDQQQLVRFSIKPQHTGQISQAQRLLSKLHIRCSQRPPLSLWAGWVLECPLFTNFIIFLIFLNTIVLMVEIELLESTNTKLWPLKLALEVAAWFILFIFILEIILMWLSSFSRFWKNAWNVFDFVVTMLSLLPEVVLLAGVTGQPVWLQFLRICRVLRSLKLFARFRQIRVIILALVRALKSMTFLLMLLLIFFYIFAVAGVYFFVEYTRSPRQDLEYHVFFSDLLNSLVTVFILFTLDHWYALLQDIWKVPEASRIFSSIYVILWLLLGSIIFRNIIVAMMVTNFQNIRKELNEEMAHREVQVKADMFKRQIIQRRKNVSREALRSTHGKTDDSSRGAIQQKESLDLSEVSEVESIYETTEADVITSASKPEETLSNKKEYQSSSSVSSTSSSDASSSESRFSESVGHLDWETLVHENLPGLMEMDQDDRVWPRDSLFRYFELLEKLQYNLEERKKLQDFAVQALMNLEDK
ncbi:cation channel sperm-associated protein 2 isoform X1 [Sapajus apella]|uniref:Cation channel sperm-associated protein 2 n=3 Tax=Sapajus apella TaxID=9515 RepID=A0A6J3JFE7_SAPAP|nr:cation channel sperm-associated protein 2 isoform X1 [Sapajus apella]XP_032153540.1 cation channel sperm-associated protein 2 isoform X1 [Sapajus apella]XP_032153541.1 cation channel sperm-associated protein 2 isoform X1 [Sapajus apella]XP_032153542.1 cation channel sperm-associated protein 2 isoform X1 [Sapajus apella]